ncbi:hypothetical protein [Pseudoduganella namucuonensis]|uniref:Uncharacterized protein n=1 Tax=Pseudoduganella namucuonensis TaxID=1035707 RepID=A0A1I7IU38_9BURK|nr:hypothetical protein [Pseudoduganella namucuonensis]SFU76455.1 hypothetical protein SAMN05216552_100944 [Pseudoduganella namucuonensis]
MAITDRTDPIFLTTEQGGQRPELMLSAVLHLMSHYTASTGENGACVKLASVIERHLKALASLPDLAPVLSATCSQLSEQWAVVVERAMPEPERDGFLSRLMSRGRAPQQPAWGD